LGAVRRGSDDTTIAIIAGAVGGGGGLLLLCCLALAVGAFVWGWRRGRSPYRRLKQPDYDAIAYGDVTGDVALPKKQLDVRHNTPHSLNRTRRTHRTRRTRWAHACAESSVVLGGSQQFHTLERLLIAPGLRLAQAILRTSNNNVGETDQVRSRVMCRACRVERVSCVSSVVSSVCGCARVVSCRVRWWG
jgi:hypothetical protein